MDTTVPKTSTKKVKILFVNYQYDELQYTNTMVHYIMRVKSTIEPHFKTGMTILYTFNI